MPRNRARSPRTRAQGPSGPVSVAPSASTATISPPVRSSTGPFRCAEIATRPAPMPARMPAGSPTLDSTQVVGVPGGASDPGRCQSLPPTGTAPGSHARHQDSGVVQARSSQLQCHTSTSGGRSGIACIQLTGPAIGWLTDSRPPRSRVTFSHSAAGRRKSTQPTSPSAPACPSLAVTSWPGIRVMP